MGRATPDGPVIAVTPGEPAGVGPDLVAELIGERWPGRLVLIADPALLEARGFPRVCPPGVSVRPVALSAPAVPGVLVQANATYVLRTLEVAVQGCLVGEFDALVTGPVHKAVINDAGYPFTGHTEWIAERTGGFPVMMLASPRLRVALVTTHVPLAQVSACITPERLWRVIETVDRDLRDRFGLPHPRLRVLGLNPHAGEGGHIGQEESRVIEPIVRRARDAGLEVSGPVAADTAFIPGALHGIDAVIAMYHDQGLIPLKQTGFEDGVNITLGLPVIRTSVDHGTALSLAGTGRADSRSLRAAVTLAFELAAHARRQARG